MTRPVVEHAGDYAVVSLTGYVDLSVRSEILDSYESAIALMNVPHLLVDVSGVTFMDSTGLSTLVSALKQVRARGGTVSIVGASDRTMRLLHMFDLDGMVTVLPEDRCLLEDAVPRTHITTRPGRIESRGPRRERRGAFVRAHIRHHE